MNSSTQRNEGEGHSSKKKKSTNSREMKNEKLIINELTLLRFVFFFCSVLLMLDSQQQLSSIHLTRAWSLCCHVAACQRAKRKQSKERNSQKFSGSKWECLFTASISPRGWADYEGLVEAGREYGVMAGTTESVKISHKKKSEREWMKNLRKRERPKEDNYDEDSNKL